MTEPSDTPRYDALEQHERHNNTAETMYWFRQYKLLASTLERELAALERQQSAVRAAVLEEVAGLVSARMANKPYAADRTDYGRGSYDEAKTIFEEIRQLATAPG